MEVGRKVGASIGAYYSELVEGMSVDAQAAVTTWEDEEAPSPFQAIQAARLMRTVKRARGTV